MHKKILSVTHIEDLAGTVINDNYNLKKGTIGNMFCGDYCISYESLGNEKDDSNVIFPGVYVVRRRGYEYFLRPKEILLEPNVPRVDSVDISEKIQTFLDKREFFSSRKLFPKRGALLHGPPGCGKTHSINQCVTDLRGEHGVAVYIAMDEARISDVVNLFEKMELDPTVDKLFVIIEDLGGGEMTDEKKGFLIPSQSDLLAFLDGNSLPWKNLPTVILSTTNYPKNFLANILDRPGRFDEIIEFKLPSGDAALAYAQSMGIPITDFDERSLMKGGVGLAHVKEAVVRYAVYGEAMHNTLEYMRKQSEKIQKDLEKKLTLF
jgi:AAA+ superfamily predicted ATPase